MTDKPNKKYLIIIKIGDEHKASPIGAAKHRDRAKEVVPKTLNNIKRLNLSPKHFISGDEQMFAYCAQSTLDAKTILDMIKFPDTHGAFRKDPELKGLKCWEDDKVVVAEIGSDIEAHNIPDFFHFVFW